MIRRRRQLIHRYNDQDWELDPTAPLWKNSLLAYLGAGFDGADLRDSSGHQRHATLDDPAMWCRSGELRRNGLTFDGSQNVALPAVPQGLAGAFGFWAKPNFLVSEAASRYVFDCAAPRTLFYHRSSGDAYGWYVGSKKIFDATTSLAGLLDDGAYTHVGLAWKNGNQTVYKNGSAFATETKALSTTNSGRVDYLLGSSRFPSIGSYWDGEIVDFVEWSTWQPQSVFRQMASLRPDLGGDYIVGHQLYSPVASTEPSSTTPTQPGLEWTLGYSPANWTLDAGRAHWDVKHNPVEWTLAKG